MKMKPGTSVSLTTLHNLMYLNSFCTILLLFYGMIFWPFFELLNSDREEGLGEVVIWSVLEGKRNSFLSDSTSFCLTVGGRLKWSRWRRLVKGLGTPLFWEGLSALQKKHAGFIFFPLLSCHTLIFHCLFIHFHDLLQLLKENEFLLCYCPARIVVRRWHSEFQPY